MSTNNNTDPTPATTDYWGGWFTAAQNQAKEFAQKAHELAETASKLAQEKAAEFAQQASEMRTNYDSEVASSILGTNVATSGQPTQRNLITDIDKLDLSYVTENMISMAFPFDPKKPSAATQQVGNDINTVAKFLKQRHVGHFMIWNISEESYDYSKFADQVLEYQFPGHPAPPLGLNSILNYVGIILFCQYDQSRMERIFASASWLVLSIQAKHALSKT